ncbi:MAG: cis-prenyltransferase [Sporothrix epigloea]
MSDLYLSHIRNWILSSPPAEWVSHQLHELAIGAIKQGPIPKHIAFVMDGNRRFARNHKIETIEGHHLGFEALARVLEFCYKSGVEVITVYAFSIENFQRPKYEVDGLMELAKVKLEQIIQHGQLLERYGATVRVLGQRDLIRADVLEVVDRAIEVTKDNNRAALNICFPYTSREEITRSIRTTVEEFSSPQSPPQPSSTFSQTRIKQKILSKKLDKPEVLSTIRETSPAPSITRSEEHDGSVSSTTTLPPGSPASRSIGGGDIGRSAVLPNPESITAETLDSHMYTAGDPPVDILIRTSGVDRFSDFVLWQIHQNTQVFFLKCFWPEFDLWHYLPVLLEWQWRQKQKAMNEKPRKRKQR